MRIFAGKNDGGRGFQAYPRPPSNIYFNLFVRIIFPTFD